MDAFDAFIDSYQYHLAWLVYVGAGGAFCLFWWKATRFLGHHGWRDLLRGLALVVIFTPWFASEAHEHLAPAVVVVFMDLLVGNTDNGLAGTLVMLLSLAFMLVVLMVRQLVRRRRTLDDRAAV